MVLHTVEITGQVRQPVALHPKPWLFTRAAHHIPQFVVTNATVPQAT
ncbi:hypothetical protein L1856_22100 [Streptomyces sp. Tue 6430]|nr:hypothetical protein [Streptomyces sp. Tue 6430]